MLRVSFRAFRPVLLFPVVLLAGLPALAMAADGRPPALTPWAMYQQADWVVKAVMLGLLLASLLTWAALVAKSIELRRVGARLRALAGRFEATGSLAELAGEQDPAGLIDELRAELALSEGALGDREGLKERLVSRFDRREAALARRMGRSVALIGTIGATAPFVGLFGTVWGIMNSFVGIAREQTTNLAVVAPGIAEALLATALGLAAAIPAVVIYNHFARRIAALRGELGDAAAALLRLVSRELSRGRLGA